MKVAKTTKRPTLNLNKFLKSTGISEDEVFKALNIPKDVRWMRDMDNCKTLGSSWRVYDVARNHLNAENFDLITKLADIHEKRSEVALNKSKTSGAILNVIRFSIIDNPAYTKGVEVLQKRLRHHSSLASLHQMIRTSKNSELVRSVRQKLSLACAKAISKRLSLAELAKIRQSSNNLTEINDTAKKINESYSKRLKKFLDKSRTITQLCIARGYAKPGAEMSTIDKKITEQVLEECKKGKSFLESSRILADAWNLVSKDSNKLECMLALANRAITFNELLSVFEKYTSGTFAKELRTKIFVKLVDMADTIKQLLYLYKIKSLEEMPTDEHKKTIIQKLAALHLE